MSGESCLFAVQITADGRPLLNTFTLASCAWAAGRLIDPGCTNDKWLYGFEASAQEHALSFAEEFAVLENDEIGRELNNKSGIHVGRPIQSGDLESEIDRISTALHLTAALDPKHVRIAARQVTVKNAFEPDSHDFVNSFFLRDLERLAEEGTRSTLGRSLSLYLSADSEIEESERCDVRTSLNHLWQHTSPRLIPPGRWPVALDQSLYFSQQLAVNSALDQLAKGSSIFAVNGPPGTGKTTPMRDLIIAIVVERAQALAQLSRPELAFTGDPTTWQFDKYKRSVYPWREDLLDFGIVVTSSNNRAVENITLEIPAKRAIAQQYLAEIDYFADFASRILSERDEEAWGLSPRVSAIKQIVVNLSADSGSPIKTRLSQSLARKRLPRISEDPPTETLCVEESREGLRKRL